MNHKPFYLLFLFFFALLTAEAQDHGGKSPFLFVGHRGASYLAPQNTLASINLAWTLNADGAECDVMLTSDKRVILFHDKNTGKLTGQSYTVSETSWEQLGKLTVKPTESNLPEYSHETIPLLKDVLATIPPDRMLVIEIKTGPEILPFLKEVVDAHWHSGQISFIAFDFETITETKALYPEVPCYYLSAFKGDARNKMDAAVAANLDGLDLRHGIIDEKLVEECSQAGLDLWCWTVNDAATAIQMKNLGVSAVTTDRPGWLREQVMKQKID